MDPGPPYLIEDAPTAWMRCRPYIEQALARGDGGYWIDDVRAGIEAGDFQFWAGERCAVVTEIITMPRLRILNFWLLGGDLKELLAMRPRIELWAKVQGCKRAIGGGVYDKRGWGRMLATSGFEPRWTIYAKELTE